MPHRPAAVVILAAGLGTRMKSQVPKVLHRLGGRTLLGHVVTAAAPMVPTQMCVVVGHQSERVIAEVEGSIAAGIFSETKMRTIVQPELRGTGDAVRCALDSLPALSGTVVVLNGDTPLITAATLEDLLATHEANSAAVTVLTADVPDPTGLGRIVRDQSGAFASIVEQRDATPAQREITEINSGVLAFEVSALRQALSQLSTDNDQGQEYLTDTVAIMRAAGQRVMTHLAVDYTETLGCNDRAELAQLGALLRDRVNREWMRAGVTMLDPASVWIDVEVELAADVTVEPNVRMTGTTTVAGGAVIGPDTSLSDTTVAGGASVVRSHCLSATIGPDVTVGPFAYLRPGTVLAGEAKVGAFVETKNVTIGLGSKVPHLTYVGDATIGEHSNIGASSVFVNYDGVAKHHTTIGNHCRTGSDTMFVAPVTIGDGAYTAAGSVITSDVPPGALAVARAPQRNIEDWVIRRRPTSTSAAAAKAATVAEDREKDK